MIEVTLRIPDDKIELFIELINDLGIEDFEESDVFNNPFENETYENQKHHPDKDKDEMNLEEE